MTDTHCKKAIMKMLGINELISEYEDRCDKASSRKKNINPGQIRSRYASLVDFDAKKKVNYDVANIYNKSTTVHDHINSRNTANNNFETINKQHTIHSEINGYTKTQNASPEINQNNKVKPKLISSMENFTKNLSHKEKYHHHKKISIKSKQQSLLSVNTVSEAVIKPNQKESHNYSSYLSLKARNTEKPKNQQFKVDIDFENPTLAGINKKIQEFQNKGVKKDERNTVFKKHQKNQENEHQKTKNDKISPMGLSETISFETGNKKQKQHFISIDTNYYGFSFKNKIPFKPCKSELKKYSRLEICSTLDKSNQNQDLGMKTVSKSTSKIHPTTGRKTQSTLNTEKKDRYNSTSLMNKKKVHSSLVLKPKSILKERYQIMNVIGRGMSGQVFQAKDILSDRFVAIKEIDQTCIEYDFFREISHQNIIRYYNNFLENGKRYLVLEYFPMTLKDLLKDSKKQIDPTEEDVKHIFKSIINGLSYLHSLNIAHRDIKLDNIVISEDLTQVKFIDFGLCIDLSKIEDGGLSKDFCGTLSYLPPEIIEGQPHEPKKADIWSLGIVFYAIAIGRLPYKGKNDSEIFSKICKGKPVYPEGFNPKLKELIDYMLDKNPGKRWTVNKILSHEWLH